MKKLLIVLFVLVLACSSVWAFQGWNLFGKKSSASLAEGLGVDAPTLGEKSQATISQVQEDLQEKLTESEAESLENGQGETLNQLRPVVDEYSNSSRLTKKELQILLEKLNVVSDDIDLLIADNVAKEAEIDRVKLYVNGGFALGFRNADKVVPTLGLTANAGAKLSNGMQVGTGLTYMVCDFGKANKMIDFGWDISKLSINAVVGYEF